MNSSNRPTEPLHHGPNLGDIYYALFRHKWLILVCSVLGVIAAVGVYLMRRPVYVSEAKLLVRYVRDAKSVDIMGPDAQVRSPDARGEGIIVAEAEILSSLDLAAQVADVVGADRVLGEPGQAGMERFQAATAILRGLTVVPPRQGNVLSVKFSHPNPEVAQAVLKELVAAYLRRHVEIHRAVGIFDDFLTQQTDELRVKLNETEQELRRLKLKAGVTSVEDSKKLLADQVARLRQDLVAAEAQLAERRTIWERLKQVSANAPKPAGVTTNAEPAAMDSPISPDKEKHYRSLIARLEVLHNREMDLLMQFMPESPQVKQVRDQIAGIEKSKLALEAEEPRLLLLGQAVSRPAIGLTSTERQPLLDFVGEEAQVAALEAKIRVLTASLNEAATNTAILNDVEPAIQDLQRKKELQETNYRYFSANLEQSRIDAALGSSKLSNISVVQAASVPSRDTQGRLNLVAFALCAGVLGGVGLALLIDLVLDTSLRRPADVEQKIRIPLFLSIPDFGADGLPAPEPRPLLEMAAVGGEAAGAAGTQLAAATPAATPEDDQFRPYCEALRDRVIMHFQARELTHKPKLVGVTSAARGAGVSSISAGLAEALSETGEGRVLLVDMNARRGPSVHPFFRGRPAVKLTEALEGPHRDEAQVQDNLYVVTADELKEGRVGVLPRRFASLVPKLKASDYDYIIFDLPPVSQTSVTTRVAGLLDVTLLVLESEKTSADVAKRGVALLAESRADLAAVLNKYRRHVPERLSTDL